MSDSVGNNKRIAKNTLMLYFRMGISMLISLYTSRIVLRELGVDDYGVYSVVAGITSMFTFLNGALSEATNRFITFELGAKNFEKLNRVFSSSVVNHFILSMLVLVLCETVGLWFLNFKMVIPEGRMLAAHFVFQFSVLGTVLGIMQVPYGALIMAHEKMGVYAYLSIIDVILKLILVLFLQFISFDKLIFWASGMFLISLLYIFFNHIYCYKKFKESHFLFHKEYSMYKNMFSYSFWDLIGSMSSLAQGQGLNMLLNVFFGPVVNAARGIAMTVQGAVVQFSSNFVVASKPQIIKLYAEGNIKEMMSLVYNTSSLSYYLLFVFVLPLCLELDYVLYLWLGSYPEETVIFTILILINSLVWSIKSSRVTALHATGKIKLSNVTVGVILCLTFPVSYIFLKNGYSASSVFTITIVMTLLAEFVACFVLRLYIKFSLIDYFINVYGRALLVSALSFILPYMVHSYMDRGFLRLVVVCVISFISVCFFAYYLGFRYEVRSSVRNYIKSKLVKIRH